MPLNTTINTCKYINIHLHGFILEWTTFHQISPNTDNVSMRLSRVLVKPDHCMWVLLVVVFKLAIQWWVFFMGRKSWSRIQLVKAAYWIHGHSLWPHAFNFDGATLYYSETVALPFSNPLKPTSKHAIRKIYENHKKTGTGWDTASLQEV